MNKRDKNSYQFPIGKKGYKTKKDLIDLICMCQGRPKSKNSKFPIHDDTPNKILSGVIYLSPEKNSGTTFYNDKTGSDRTEMKWKKNRAVFFSRREKETWHSYKGDNENNRVALVYNLMTKNIKKVYEIEKKNYYLGMLRWKVNPYLFRYLKTYY